MENQQAENILWFSELDPLKQIALREFYQVITNMTEEDFEMFMSVTQPIIDKMDL